MNYEDSGKVTPYWLHMGMLFLLLILSCALSVFYYAVVDGPIESTRLSFGLLPADMLFVRWFGELSMAMPVGVLFAIAFSHSNPQHSLRWMVVAVTGFAVFVLAWLAYVLVLVAFMVQHRAG